MAGTEEILRRQFLPFLGIQVLEISRRDLSGPPPVHDLVDDADRILSLDADRGIHHVEGIAAEFLAGQEDLIFERQQCIADSALDKSGGCAAPAGIEHRHVPEQPGDELPGLLLAAAFLDYIAPCGEIAVAPVSGSLWIGNYDGNAWL